MHQDRQFSALASISDAAYYLAVGTGSIRDRVWRAVVCIHSVPLDWLGDSSAAALLRQIRAETSPLKKENHMRIRRVEGIASTIVELESRLRDFLKSC
jgi:hypothetical protein